MALLIALTRIACGTPNLLTKTSHLFIINLDFPGMRG